MTEYKTFKEKLRVRKELFYNEGKMFGAYGFEFVDSTNPDIRLNQWNNFSIAGEVQRLVEGKTYMIAFEETFDERRGVDAYKFIEVLSEGIKGRDANEEFLIAAIGGKHAGDIIAQFPHETELIQAILNDKIDITKVSGIGEARLLRIKEKIIGVEKYSEALIKLAPMGIGIETIIRLSDVLGSPEKLLEIIEEDIYALTKVKGLGFKRVDEYALKLGGSLDDPQRIKAGSLYVIEQLSSFGDTRIDIEVFDKKMCDILDIEVVNDELFTSILSDERIYYSNGYITLEEYYREEIEIIERLRALRDNFKGQANDKDIELAIEQEEAKNNFKFNKEQREAIYNAANNGVFILDGKGGTGKTASLLTAVRAMNKNHMACALSGKAAKVLTQYGLNSATIHRTLGFDGKKFAFIHNERYPLGTEVVILDEASMVDNKLFLDLVRAVPKGAQFIIVGDSGQLPAIGRGAMFDSLLGATEFCHTTLKEVHRQAKDSGTLVAANSVREGKQFIDSKAYGVHKFGTRNDLFYNGYTDATLIPNDLYNLIKRYTENPNTNNDDAQVITAMKERGNTSVVKLNKMLQPLFNPDDKVSDVMHGKVYQFRKNDRVIQQGNNYSAKPVSLKNFQLYAAGVVDLKEIIPKDEDEFEQVFNGTFGKIIACADGVGMLIQFEDALSPVLYLKNKNVDETGVLDLGYVISCHRSQGSGFKNVFLAITYGDYMLLSRQFLYTAMTRTINNCFILGETNAIQYAVRTDKGKTRKVFATELLK